MNEELKMRLCYYSGIKTGMDGLLKAIENVEESGHKITVDIIKFLIKDTANHAEQSAIELGGGELIDILNGGE